MIVVGQRIRVFDFDNLGRGKGHDCRSRDRPGCDRKSSWSLNRHRKVYIVNGESGLVGVPNELYDITRGYQR